MFGSLLDSIASTDQKFGLVEAQNFVPSIWAPGAEGASGATGYARDHCDPWRPVFVWERESEERREVRRNEKAHIGVGHSDHDGADDVLWRCGVRQDSVCGHRVYQRRRQPGWRPTAHLQ